MRSLRSLLVLVALAAPAPALAQSPADPAAPAQAAPAPAAVVAPATAPAPPDTSPPWQPAAASVLGVLALAIRRYKILRWLPDRIEDAATVGVLGCLGSAIPMLEGGGFVWPGSLFTAIAAGVTAAVALWMPASKDPPPPAGTVLRGGAAAGLALALLLGGGCKTSPQVIATTATVATVQTADAGIDYFESHVTDWEVKIAQDAVAGCKTAATRDLYRACTDAVTGPRRQPIDRVKLAIKAYRIAVVAGQSVDSALSNLTGALAAVGVAVGGAR